MRNSLIFLLGRVSLRFLKDAKTLCFLELGVCRHYYELFRLTGGKCAIISG